MHPQRPQATAAAPALPHGTALDVLGGICPAGAPHEQGHPAFESLNYEEVENTVYRADKASSTSLDGIAFVTGRWLICLLIGARAPRGRLGARLRGSCATRAPETARAPTCTYMHAYAQHVCTHMHAHARAGMATALAAFAVNVSVENISVWAAFQPN